MLHRIFLSDSGKYAAVDEAVTRGLEMIREGVDIIDIGGESTRPGANPVDQKEEKKRVLPVIAEIRRQSGIPISVDTYKSQVASEALDAGADIVNDISALRMDGAMVSLVTKRNVPVILMHMQGTPLTMQQNPSYSDCVQEICDFFGERIEFCRTNGIDRGMIILDPGIGFGKRLEDNLQILSELNRLKQFGLPILVGTSRKSFIARLSETDKPAESRLGGSLASALIAVLNGANIVRVHDVALTVEAMRVLRAVQVSQ